MNSNYYAFIKAWQSNKTSSSVFFQAEELNTIVGNAFRMAYVAQLQRQPILQDVISPQSSPPYRKDKQENRSSWVRTYFVSYPCQWRRFLLIFILSTR